MITKELLSLVLGKEVEIVTVGKINLTYQINYDIDNVNLDTLGRLCKEWCLEDGEYNIEIWEDNTFFNIEIQLQVFDYQLADGVVFMLETKQDEWLESIIKATEWVAKEKGLL